MVHKVFKVSLILKKLRTVRVGTLIALGALCLSFWNFWYAQLRIEKRLILSVLEIFGEYTPPTSALRLLVAFVNEGNREAAITNVAIELYDPLNPSSSTPLEWREKVPLVISPKSVQVEDMLFGKDAAESVLSVYGSDYRINLKLRIELVDSDAKLHIISQTIAELTLNKEGLFGQGPGFNIWITDTLPRSITLLPSQESEVKIIGTVTERYIPLMKKTEIYIPFPKKSEYYEDRGQATEGENEMREESDSISGELKRLHN